jgi:hypothetical protein
VHLRGFASSREAEHSDSREGANPRSWDIRMYPLVEFMVEPEEMLRHLLVPKQVALGYRPTADH